VLLQSSHIEQTPPQGEGGGGEGGWKRLMSPSELGVIAGGADEHCCVGQVGDRRELAPIWGRRGRGLYVEMSHVT